MKEGLTGIAIAALCAAVMLRALLGMAELPAPTTGTCDVQTAEQAEDC